MATRRRAFTGICVGVALLTGCTSSEEQIRKAIQQTQDVKQGIENAIAATHRAEAPQIPPTSTITLTPTNTSTAEATNTATPPLGKAYVPDLVGVNIEDAKATCSAASLPFFWVELINKDVPEWSVFAQTPAAGGLIDLNAKQSNKKLKLLMSVYKFTETPKPQPKRGSSTSDPCGGLTYEGICQGNVAYWCENNQVWYWNCGSCGGTCGYDPGVGNTCFCP